MLYRFMTVIDAGLLIIDFVINLVIGTAQLCTACGRAFYWLLGWKPYREIMFLTGNDLGCDRDLCLLRVVVLALTSQPAPA